MGMKAPLSDLVGAGRSIVVALIAGL